jgi:hypothetical protein
MYRFSQIVTPAARTHMEAQLSFLNDLSKIRVPHRSAVQ